MSIEHKSKLYITYFKIVVTKFKETNINFLIISVKSLDRIAGGGMDEINSMFADLNEELDSMRECVAFLYRFVKLHFIFLSQSNMFNNDNCH